MQRNVKFRAMYFIAIEGYMVKCFVPRDKEWSVSFFLVQKMEFIPFFSRKDKLSMEQRTNHLCCDLQSVQVSSSLCRRRFSCARYWNCQSGNEDTTLTLILEECD